MAVAIEPVDKFLGTQCRRVQVKVWSMFSWRNEQPWVIDRAARQMSKAALSSPREAHRQS